MEVIGSLSDSGQILQLLAPQGAIAVVTVTHSITHSHILHIVVLPPASMVFLSDFIFIVLWIMFGCLYQS